MRVWLCLLFIVLASPAGAQQMTLDLGADQSLAGRSMLLFGAITLLSVAPGLAIMITCFPFVVTVLSITRQGLGLQSAPPNMLIVSLSLFLTWFIMEPTFTQSWEAGGRPFAAGQIGIEDAFTQAMGPFRTFMSARVDPDTLQRFLALRNLPAGDGGTAVPLSVLVPSFMLSEITRAFEIGFMVYLPFLIIDLVVSAILMSMGMMMVPPAAVALPFKLAFFVVANGWTLISDALVRSYIG